MDRINKLLRRLTPKQIVAAGIAAWVLGVALVIFGIGPIAVALLLPLGEATAAVVGLLIYFAGGFAVGHYVGKTFAEAYYDRQSDDAVHEFLVEYEARKAHGESV